MILHESAEMYLETILLLSRELEYVRAVDIANRMGFSKPTISEWMGKLGKAGLVDVDGNGHIELTEEGAERAENIYARHLLLSEFFERIGVSPEVAAEDACRVEHYISEETFGKLKEHIHTLEERSGDHPMIG